MSSFFMPFIRSNWVLWYYNVMSDDKKYNVVDAVDIFWRLPTAQISGGGDE